MGFGKLGRVVSWILRFLRLSKKFTWLAFTRTAAFFSSGWRSYLAMAFFVGYSNRRLFFTGDLLKILMGIGSRIGAADRLIAENLQTILLGATGVSYADALWVIISSTVLILWWVRSLRFTLEFAILGDAVPDMGLWLISFAFFVLTVVAAEQRLPLAVVEVVLNLPEILEVSRLNPLTDPVNATANFTEVNISSVEL